MNPNVLVIDSVYLVAMDIERVLTEGLGCQVSLGTPASLLEDLAGGSFQIVVLEADALLDRLASLVERIRETGATLVFSTTNAEYAGGIPDFSDFPVILKPFPEPQVLEAVKRCLSGLALKA